MRLSPILRTILAIALAVLICYIIISLMAGAVLLVKAAFIILVVLVILAVLGA